MEQGNPIEEIAGLHVEEIDQRSPNVSDFMFKVIMLGDPGKWFSNHS